MEYTFEDVLNIYMEQIPDDDEIKTQIANTMNYKQDSERKKPLNQEPQFILIENKQNKIKINNEYLMDIFHQQCEVGKISSSYVVFVVLLTQITNLFDQKQLNVSSYKKNNQQIEKIILFSNDISVNSVYCTYLSFKNQNNMLNYYSCINEDTNNILTPHYYEIYLKQVDNLLLKKKNQQIWKRAFKQFILLYIWMIEHCQGFNETQIQLNKIIMKYNSPNLLNYAQQLATDILQMDQQFSELLQTAFIIISQLLNRDQSGDNKILQKTVLEQINIDFLQKFYSGNLLQLNQLYQHKSYFLYYYSQFLNIQTDMATSIVCDIKEQIESEQLNKHVLHINNGQITSTINLKDDFKYLVIFDLDEMQELKSFNIEKLQYSDKEKKHSLSNNYRYSNNQYYYIHLHDSVSAHIDISNQLKMCCLNKITTSDPKQPCTQIHTPYAVIVGQQYQQAIKSKLNHPLLCFTDHLQQKTIQILKRTLNNENTLSYIQKSENQKEQLKYSTLSVYQDESLNPHFCNLQASQLACLIHIFFQDLIIIIGAPGAGKTFTTAQIVRFFLLALRQVLYIPSIYQEQFIPVQNVFKTAYSSNYMQIFFSLLNNKPKNQIIITAHSNNAVDQMVEQIQKQNVDCRPIIFRIGHSTKNQIVLKYTIDGWIEKFFVEVCSNQQNAQGIKDINDKLRQIYYTLTQIKSPLFSIFERRESLSSYLLSAASVIAGTTTVLQHNRNYTNIKLYPVLIVEEAARMTEYNIAALFDKQPIKVILLGDVMQLPPLIRDKHLEKEASLSKSLFFKLVHQVNDVIILDEQYRVPTRICDLYRNVYKNNLPQKLQINELIDCKQDLSDSFKYIRVNGKFSNETNQKEVDYVVRLIAKLINKDPQKILLSEITVLSYYKKQAQLIQDTYLKVNNNVIQCYTVDEYQGSENNIIILSCVCDYPSRFADDLNRNLVAFSRAKKQMYVVGNLERFQNEICRNVLQFYDSQNNRE